MALVGLAAIAALIWSFGLLYAVLGVAVLVCLVVFGRAIEIRRLDRQGGLDQTKSFWAYLQQAWAGLSKESEKKKKAAPMPRDAGRSSGSRAEARDPALGLTFPEPAKPESSLHSSKGVPMLPAKFAFDYADRYGVLSRRLVTVHRAGQSHGRKYLEGICHERGAVRTFRLDRIIGQLQCTSSHNKYRPDDLLYAAGTNEELNAKLALWHAQDRVWETAVFFAGFGATRLEQLEILAYAAGWRVHASLGTTVDYMVEGPMAGRRQREKAERLGISIIDENVFRAMLS